MKVKYNLVESLFVMTLIIMYFSTSVIFDYGKFYYVKYLLAVSWIIFFMFKNQKKHNKLIIKRELVNYLKLYISRYLAMLIFSMLIFFFYRNSFDLLTRGISTILYQMIAVVFAITSVALFGKRTLNLFVKAGVINYCIVCIVFLLTEDWILAVSTLSFGGTVLEVNELTFAFTLVFTYYLYRYIKKIDEHNSYTIKRLAICLIILMLGFKRIVFLAILFTILLIRILSGFEKKTSKKIIDVCSILLIFSAFFYIYSIYEGILKWFIYYYNINSMSRIELYTYFSDLTKFSVTYIGKGIGFCEKTIEWDLAYLQTYIYGIKAMGIHSDILRYYVEVGFWGLLIVLYDLLYRIPGFFMKRKCNDGYQIAYILSLITYILYFTDNTAVYFMYLVLFTLIPTYHREFIENNHKVEGKNYG